MHALIDGDVIVYNAGFASDAAAKKESGGTRDHEPLSYCLHGVSEKIKSIENAVGATRTTIFLSHPVNRREALFPEYKANRDPTHKPYWYDEIKEFLLDHKGAIYSEPGDEADDALGIAAMMSDDTIVCSIDKDLDMIPGLHYNWSKNNVGKGVYETQDPEALQAFYTQIITGDSTDNIPGLYKKLGIKASAAHKMPIEGMTRAKEMYDYVLKVYNGDVDFVHLVAQLLWIKRDNRLWAPPA